MKLPVEHGEQNVDREREEDLGRVAAVAVSVKLMGLLRPSLARFQEPQDWR